MTGALIILAVTVIVGAILYIVHRFTTRPGEETQVNEPQRPEGCCGQHAVCEKDSLLQGISNQIVYYDDQELDEYRGIAADDYTEAQIEQFRDVLYTLQRDDLAPWARSIALRGIVMPAPIHDEFIMLAAEARSQKLQQQQP
ncbi:MAG: phospholipase [Muribaculaceae bacterium]